MEYMVGVFLPHGKRKYLAYMPTVHQSAHMECVVGPLVGMTEVPY